MILGGMYYYEIKKKFVNVNLLFGMCVWEKYVMILCEYRKYDWFKKLYDELFLWMFEKKKNLWMVCIFDNGYLWVNEIG